MNAILIHNNPIIWQKIMPDKKEYCISFKYFVWMKLQLRKTDYKLMFKYQSN